MRGTYLRACAEASSIRPRPGGAQCGERPDLRFQLMINWDAPAAPDGGSGVIALAGDQGAMCRCWIESPASEAPSQLGGSTREVAGKAASDQVLIRAGAAGAR